MVEVVFDPQTYPTLKEKNVTTLYSSEGITRAKAIAPTYHVFGRASEVYWFFPDSIYLEIYDTAFNIQGTVRADTAYRYERRQIWELKGNVYMTNFEGVRFQSEHVFWNEQKETIYSDTVIKITKGETVTIGKKGFTSNQQLTKWEIFQSDIEMPVDMKNRSHSEIETPVSVTDSVP